LGRLNGFLRERRDPRDTGWQAVAFRIVFALIRPPLVQHLLCPRLQRVRPARETKVGRRPDALETCLAVRHPRCWSQRGRRLTLAPSSAFATLPRAARPHGA